MRWRVGDFFSCPFWANTEGVGVDLSDVKNIQNQTIEAVFAQAKLQKPTASWQQSGGKTGQHSEHLGFILADMQFLQRAYPNSTW